MYFKFESTIIFHKLFVRVSFSCISHLMKAKCYESMGKTVCQNAFRLICLIKREHLGLK